MRNGFHDGFTLIEILIVLLIISIIITVTITSFGDFGAERRERMQLSQFANKIKFLQEKAILKSTIITLPFKPTIIFYPDGKITPLVLTIKGNYQWIFRVENNGNISFEKNNHHTAGQDGYGFSKLNVPVL